jgi:hypothetical protein
MEQTVWLYFGVITVILGFGIVAKLIIDHKNQSKNDLFDQAIDLIKNQCNFVCSSSPGTKISQEVTLPSGLVLTSEEKRICGRYNTEDRCAVCNCELSNYTLNLNTSLALKTFQSHTYFCFFTRGDINVDMECQG